ncbi:luciferase family oxidoreductase, group 1 [Paracoccus aminovorans]|uniref:Luciferase-like monooxygenase n=1 Tax=Paracoccus aminovorans TaxID=34004 RepID=A0A1I2XP48_9RHOB|nr:LLM class flavin-dependent oxidoreductase [Paracoccus aminovorans]CQR87325.1 luciferase family protein [Paracoccus aminovorans]SFH15264.1 luciferase family oxidoreductase, group 1 [Paracoccus aminovorans]
MEFSVLDLAVVAEGADARQAIANSVSLAQAAEGWGYKRFWLAEHHNMPGIASAATAVLIGHVAEHTQTIRVGAGGVMLPNHAPLAIAEQFGTLATIHGDRIDLGLGRAPGGDGAVMHALRRAMQRNDDFPNDVVELMRYLGTPRPGAPVAAHPGEGTNVPVWILGSSLYGASLAAVLGLPYAFASHFAPGDLEQAVGLYRERFEATEFGTRPRFMLAVNVIAADTDAEAQRLRSSQMISFARLRTGMPGLLPPPVDDIHDAVPAAVLPMVEHALSVSAVGAPQTVATQLDALIATYRPDELILVGNIYDQAARHRSFAIAAEILRGRA